MAGRLRARWGAAVAAALAVIAIPLVLAQGAGAAPVPPGDFTCGVTVFTACNQTAHFSTPSGTSAPEVGAPSPQATGCPAFVADHAPAIHGTRTRLRLPILYNPPARLVSPPRPRARATLAPRHRTAAH